MLWIDSCIWFDFHSAIGCIFKEGAVFCQSALNHVPCKEENLSAWPSSHVFSRDPVASLLCAYMSLHLMISLHVNCNTNHNPQKEKLMKEMDFDWWSLAGLFQRCISTCSHRLGHVLSVEGFLQLVWEPLAGFLNCCLYQISLSFKATSLWRYNQTSDWPGQRGTIRRISSSFETLWLVNQLMSSSWKTRQLCKLISILRLSIFYDKNMIWLWFWDLL